MRVLRGKKTVELLEVLGFLSFSICFLNSSICAVAFLFKNTDKLLAF